MHGVSCFWVINHSIKAFGPCTNAGKSRISSARIVLEGEREREREKK